MIKNEVEKKRSDTNKKEKSKEKKNEWRYNDGEKLSATGQKEYKMLNENPCIKKG